MSFFSVITVGGTIDKVYYDAASNFEVGDSQIKQVLKTAGIADFEVISLMRKDSLQMNDADREAVKQAVLASTADHVLVTHGTDTMAITARYLGDAGGKTVVFTGAMQPARFHDTDAIFNIGFALGTLANIEPGVYLAMNGRVFDPIKARKNRDVGRFEDTD